MSIKSSIASVAEFKGQQSPAVFQKACERIIDGGLDECTNILEAVVRAIETKRSDAVASIIRVLETGNQRLAGVINQVHPPALSATELPSLAKEYEAAKALSRAKYAPENLPKDIREATRNVTDLCARAHAYALRLLPVLETMLNKPVKKPVAKKPSPADEDTGDFDLVLDASPNAAAPKPGDTGIMGAAASAKETDSDDDDDDFFRNIELGEFSVSDDTPSGDDLKIDPKPPKTK